MSGVSQPNDNNISVKTSSLQQGARLFFKLFSNRMRRIVPFLLINLVLLLHLQHLFAQDSAGNILHWEFSSSKNGDSGYILILQGKIQKDWKLFSTTMRDDLPNTRITLDSSAAARIKAIEEKGILQVRKEPLLDNAEIRYF